MIYEKFTIPNHTEELDKVNKFIVKIKRDYHNQLSKNTLDTKSAKNYVLLLENTLQLVGDLSDMIYQRKGELNDIYTKKYSKSPIMGENLFTKHYYDLHKPYDKLKNMAWHLLFEINKSSN